MRRLGAACILALAASGCAPAGAPLSPATEPRTIEPPRAVYARAARALRQGRAEEAAVLLASLDGRYPVLADHVLAMRAEAARELGDLEGEELLLTRLLREHPRSIFVGEARLRLAEIGLERGDIDRAAALLAQADVDTDAALGLRARLLAGDVAAARGAYGRAIGIWAGVRREAAGSDAGREAARRIRQIREHTGLFGPGPQEVPTELDLLLREGDPEGALNLADQWLSRVPADIRPAVALGRVRALVALGRPEQAADAARLLSREYPGAAEGPRALAVAATALWNRDRDAAAAALYRRIVDHHSRHPAAAEALYALGRIAETAGDARRARAHYSSLARRFPRHPLTAAARWRIGWSYYRAGQWAAARQAFARARPHAPAEWRSTALYWEARAAAAAGDIAGARELYETLLAREPHGYYAYWARLRLGLREVTSREPTPVLDGVQEPPPGADLYHWRRARELAALGLAGTAARELRAYEKDNAGDTRIYPALAAAYADIGSLRDVLRLQRAGVRGDERLLYPTAFDHIVLPEAQRAGIDPFWLWAVIRQESFFDPAARSPAGAQGLMQLMPETGCAAAARQGISCDDIDLYDPGDNVRLGATHLRELLERYRGDVLRALAAYNAGVDAVTKWDQRLPAAPDDEWVESISYRETRDYVKKVLAHYLRYRSLYGPPGPGGRVNTEGRALRDGQTRRAKRSRFPLG